MAYFPKPNFNSVWAATGIKIQPPSAKVDQGWIVEIPPYEYDNWIINRQDSMLAHVNQCGIPVWDNQTEYWAGRSYVQSSVGTLYRANKNSTNVNPEGDTTDTWRVAFQPFGDALVKWANLADVQDKAQARINLGIKEDSYYDGRYLAKASNLADVPNKSSARHNLGVYGKDETFNRTEIYDLGAPGSIVYFACTDIPWPYLAADGRAVSRSEYGRLFNRIGTVFGAGDGHSTFNVPDLRGEFIRGWDANRGIDPGRGWSTVQGSQNAQHNHIATMLPSGDHQHYLSGNTHTNGAHTHHVNDPGHNHITNVPAKPDYPGAGPNAMQDGRVQEVWYIPINSTWSQTGIWLSSSGAHQHFFEGWSSWNGNHAHEVTVHNSGGNESRPRNIALIAAIRCV